MNKPLPGFSIALSGVAHQFRDRSGRPATALDGVDLTIEAGQIAAVVGPSGAGKSTLLNLLDGRLTGWNGGALVLGRPLSPAAPPTRPARVETGFIFQDFALVERATAYQNVLNGRLGRAGVLASLIGHFSRADHDAVRRALQDTGIADLADRRVDRLSGGQRQRVAIARCLAQDPSLILADEPVSSLDPKTAEDMLELLAGAARSRRATLVFTSHQPDLAARHADRIIALKAGRVALDCPASELKPADLDRIYGTTDLAPPALRLVG